MKYEPLSKKELLKLKLDNPTNALINQLIGDICYWKTEAERSQNTTMTKMKKVYLAGPDVFRKDVLRHAQEIKELCREHGFEPLFPLDAEISDFKNDRETAYRIYLANTKMIQQADGVVANIEPFRGVSADVGTIYEVGYAEALGKKTALYSTDGRTYVERCTAELDTHIETHAGGDDIRDANDMLVEQFGLVDNLMFAARPRIWDSLAEALSDLYMQLTFNKIRQEVA